MPTFKYTVKDPSGNTITGRTQADNQQGLVEILRKQHMVIISIAEEKPKIKLFDTNKGKVKIDDLVVFSRQLATIVDAGIPLVGALDVLSQQVENEYFKTIIAGMRDKIESGMSFSAALKEHPEVFSKLFVNMIVAGEGSGALDEILDRVATYLEKTASLRRKIKSALIYPAIVTVMAVLITIVLLIKVVPTFESIFADFGTGLPLPTLILLAISDFLRKYLLLFIVVSFFAFIGLLRYSETKQGSLRLDSIKLKLPIFGKLIKKVCLARFARTLSTLTKSGVAILSALDIVGETSGNRVIEEAILNAKNSIREGENITDPLIKSGVFPPMVTKMISVGERSGELEKMLGKIADFYEDEVDTAVNGLTSMIEPLIIAFLGIVIGSIVIAMFLPVFKLTQVIAM